MTANIRPADYFLDVILPGLPIAEAENSFGEVMEAARLKATYLLSFVDCFAAATAIRERAALVAGDPEFKKLGSGALKDSGAPSQKPENSNFSWICFWVRIPRL